MVDSGPCGVKLEAITASLSILPGQAHANSLSSAARYELQPQSEGRSETIFLRHGDQIHLPNAQSYLTCQWTDSEVQVNSSAADAMRIAVTPEEAQSEGDGTKDPAVNVAKSQPRATPQLSNQRSTTVIQETPTAARTGNVTDIYEADVQEAEAFSTARTGESQDQMQPQLPLNARTSSPRVHIPSRSAKKRTRSLADEADADASKSDNGTFAGPSKRAKTSDSDTEDSRLSNVDVAQPEQSAPPRSQRGSQRSISNTTVREDYDGPVSRVACSNSTITKASAAVKFLKKQGGAFVENLADDFNVLCVRDGDLQKTTKVLYAIARGIPIVTDQWLLESASAKRLLAVSAFKPSIPKQEEEWKIKLDDILEKPQTPFTDFTVHFTKSLKTRYASSFSDIEAVCKAAGATSVTSGATKIKKTGNTIALAADEDDVEAQKLIKEGTTCYTKDFFTYSILRGVVDLESDEFKIEGAAAGETPSKEQKKKRSRKSN
ncbi:uncharacterized protein J4E78_001536 [Alternaria triticimaculans]|uniref:uncharacterized protein n=1 Tax=Alternaria triticimaculans TaxID=297637 RepID=UPI0020C58624|nr:uncharacterized protein J4E78_001536 [Alternaria triticimaculans]KAI4673032.1 hypothetical protein J4E78_001536 [Alternaria triticimaculans]